MNEAGQPEPAVPERLRESEDALQQFLDTTPTGLVRNSRDLRFVLVNRAYARLVGRRVDQIIGRSLAEVLGEEALSRIRPYIDRVLTGEPVEYEVEMALAEGPHWLHVIYTPDRNPDGDVVGWVASITDITGQKRTEQALRQRHRLQRLLAQVGELGTRLSRAEKLIESVCELVAIEFGVSRCGLAQIDIVAGESLIVGDYHGTLPSLAGRHAITPCIERWQNPGVAGRAVAIEDASVDPLVAEHYEVAFAPLAVRAHLSVALQREEKWVATLWVSDHEPRQWRPDEAEALTLVAEQVWNVIERIRAGDALRAHKDHLRFVTDHAPVLLVQCDRDKRFTFANVPYTERFGLHPSDVVGRRISEVLGEPAYESIRSYTDRVLAGDRVEFETEVPYVYGKRWMRCAYVPQRDEAGAVTGFVGAMQDVTRWREAEETLRRSEERFRATFENAAVGIAHVGLDGRWLRVNDRLCEIVGHTRERLLSMTFQDITYPADLEADVAQVQEMIAGRLQTFSMDKRYLRGDGTIVWATLTVSMARKSDGTPDYFISVVEDISAKKDVEAAFRDADQRKDEFLALLAHELRNPLSPIRTSMALLRARPGTDPNLVRCRDIIDRQVTQMTRLLDDLLDVSRLSRGKLTLQRGRVTIGNILAAAIEANLPLIGQRGHRVDIQTPEEPVLLDADAARLTQVFGNLLNNAVKYSHPGTTLHVSAAPEDDWVVVRVRDSGIGIPASMIDKVFDLFTQADSARAHAPGGLGIGLSLAQRLVEMHGGTIGVTSAGPGEGSEFTVRLPLLRQETSDGLPRPSSAAAGVSVLERRILVVDDNEDVADTHAMLLQDSGYEVQTVYNGEAALAVFEQFQPDLVLLDIGLPDISGHEVCRRIRSCPGGGAAMIVAVTGWGQARDRERSLAAGFDRHLVKPVDPEALVGLARAVRRPRLQWPPRPEL